MTIKLQMSLPASAMKENYCIDVKKENGMFVAHISSQDSDFKAVGTPFPGYMESLEEAARIIIDHDRSSHPEEPHAG